jgi:type I restriction enzyme M protein
MALPEYLESRRLYLLKSFAKNPFRLHSAVGVLSESNGDDEKQVLVYLSELRKAGFLRTERDPENGRKSVYQLITEDEKLSAIKEELQSSKLSRSDIETILKKAADLIRTRVDYKFILILLFLKRISDKWQDEYDAAYKKALKDGLSDDFAHIEAEKRYHHDFDLPKEFLWDEIRKDPSRLPEKFSRAMREIADRNESLRDVLDNVDFISFTSNIENSEILRQLVELFSEKRLSHVSADILGDAYEWVLRYFAPTKAKEGEVYTPKEVDDLLIGLLDPQPTESVYDPACGSAGMLIAAHQLVQKKHGEKSTRKLFLYGQEQNPKTLALAKMNMYIHDIPDHHLEGGDTLLYPKFKEKGITQQFDVVIANPPWNLDGYPEEVLRKGEFHAQRFSYGYAPKQSADWIWIQHMLSSSTPNHGRVGVILDNGALFRGGKEKSIRQKIIDSDLLECIILLPEKLFYNTGAPGCILLFNNAKPHEHKDHVLVINASKEYEKHSEVRKLNRLSEKNLQKIVDAYQHFTKEDGFSLAIPKKLIAENDYNLNVTLYVYPEEVEEEIDIPKELRELKELEKKQTEITRQLEEYQRVIK